MHGVYWLTWVGNAPTHSHFQHTSEFDRDSRHTPAIPIKCAVAIQEDSDGKTIRASERLKPCMKA